MAQAVYYKSYSSLAVNYYESSNSARVSPKQPFWKRWLIAMKQWFKKPAKRRIKIR